jgi:small-conductance mechanosensitive channel
VYFLSCNSLNNLQIIVNRSRAQSRVSVTKIPIRLEDIQKVPALSEEIRAMLRSNPKVILETDAPYCYLSKLENSYGELVMGCILQKMVR